MVKFWKNIVTRSAILIIIVTATLMWVPSARQAGLINFWSVRFTHYLFSSAVEKPTLAYPPAVHNRADIWLAIAALKSGNPDLAETLISVQASQDEPFAMHLMADVRLVEGDFAGAVAIWQQAEDVDTLLRAAARVQQDGRLEEALMAYEVARKLDSNSGTLPLANFLLDCMQDYGRAENVLRHSLATYPKSSYWPVWLRRLGDSLRGQYRWDEAATAYESVIIETPNDWAAHVGLGWARYERGDGLQAAISEFQEAIKYPKSQENGYLAIAQVLTREKRFEEADAWFMQALALNPNAWWLYMARGNTARQAGNLDLAWAMYLETLERFPDNAWVYYEMSYVYQETEQSEQAITSIEQALVLTPTPQWSFYTRAGNIYEWIGDESRALYAYRQALLIDPQNVAALEGVERLDK